MAGRLFYQDLLLDGSLLIILLIVAMDNDEKDDPSEDGFDPTEEVGPRDSEAHPKRCQFKSSDEKVTPDECGFEPDEEILESMPDEPIKAYIAEDGLPEVDIPDPEDAAAPPFTYETQLCVEDDREWVELWEHEIFSRHPSFDKNFSPGTGQWGSPYDSAGRSIQRRSFGPDQVRRRFGVHVAVEKGDLGDHRDGWVIVRPKRERCIHYRRQVFSFKGAPGKQKVFRVCTARRSNGGAYMTVGDEAIWECDLRNPRDPETEQAQDEKDRAKLIDRPDLIRVPILGFAGEDIYKEESNEQ